MAGPGHDGNSAIWRILGLLERVKKSGSGWEASCPGPRHSDGQDRHPSLSVGLGLDSRVLLKCFTGCELEEILRPIGLSMADLFEKSQTGNPVRRFRLLNRSGEVVAEHVREDLTATNDKLIRWERNGKNGLGGMPVADLPLYGLPALEQADYRVPVVVCEGEKAAQALIDMGLLAVGTVTGAAGTPSAASLQPLQGRENVWLWPDNDDAGREHMGRIAALLKPAPQWIRWSAALEHGDAADFLGGGGTAAGIASMLEVPEARHIWRSPELMAAAFAPTQWAIPGLVPVGLSILAGRPKLGKSWLALGWAVDVANGNAAFLHKMATTQGECLYLALEDGPQRIQERLAMVFGERLPPSDLHIACEWSRLDEGGLDELDRWLLSHVRTRLVVVDTFKRVRATEKKNARLYDSDYDAVLPLAALARLRGVAIMVVLHTRKGESDDPLELISGTLGLTGAADGVLVLRRERGQADASLFATGRDVEEQDLALRWERDEFQWSLLGAAEDYRRSKERRAILEVIASVPGMPAGEIADAVQKTRGSVRYLLFVMVRDGEVRNRDGKYFPSNSRAGKSTTDNYSSNTAVGQYAEGAKDARHARARSTTPISPNTDIPNSNTDTLSTNRSLSTNSPYSSSSGVRGGGVCKKCGRGPETHGEQDLAQCSWDEAS